MIERRELLAGGLWAGLAALAGCSSPARRAIAGRIVDEDHVLGHRLRDAALPVPSGAGERIPVAIVGAGVAGLSAAWRLAREGLDDFVVLDLASRPGGTSRSGTIAGLRHPWGAHYVPVPRREQRALVAFLEDAGVVTGRDAAGRPQVAAETLVRAPQERLCALGYWEEGTWLEAGASERDRHESARFDELVREHVALDGEGRRLFDLPLAHSSPERRELDLLGAAQWADAERLAGERVRWSLEYATRDDFGATLEETSAWALLHYFASRADLETGETPEYMTWPEGNAFLVERLADGLGPRVRTAAAATAVRAGAGGVEVDVYDAARDAATRLLADAAILATPQYVTARLLAEDPARESRRRFRYGPWVVANLHLDRAPVSRGFPQAWDNVLYESASVGYVDATHQLDRLDARDTVWTWYLPLAGENEQNARARMLAAPWEHWRDVVLADLRRAHPDVDECVTRIDVWRWGHAMVKPTPGFVWGAARASAAEPVGRVHFAHSDLSGVALFEEAHWQGVRAAEEVLAERGMEFESLL